MPARTTTTLPSRRWVAALAGLSFALTSALVTTSGAPATAIDEVSKTRPEHGPLGPITVIGDSVMLGSFLFGPMLDDHLVAAGWGPVRVRAGVGDNTGAFGGRATTKATHWIQTWRAQGWDPAAVVINLGANDAVNCEANLQCAYDAIMHVVNAIGPGKRIWWPKITHHPVVRHRQDAWNAALDRVARERADFYTWDWPTVMYSMGMYASDHIHQTAPGYRERSRAMAHEITASLARGSMTGGPAAPPAPTGPPTEMVPIGPIRVLDTRRQAPGRVPAGTTIQVDVSDHVPVGTTAIAAYITAVAPSAAGHLGAHPCNPGANASFANYPPGITRGAVTITPLTADRTFCVTTHAAADLVVDLQAAFVPDGLRLDALATPQRLVDTRRTGASQHLELRAPAGAEAVALNLTAVNAHAPGHVIAHPCITPTPTVANVNYLAREVIAGAAYVPVSDSGTICIDTFTPVDLVVDLTGTFSSAGELAFQPAVPTRMLDTRRGIGGWTPVHGLGQTIRATVAPSHARAVTGTITLVAPLRNSHLQTWGCGSRDENSNVNAGSGATLANFLTTGADQGQLCIFAVNTGHTLFDTTGWWIP